MRYDIGFLGGGQLARMSIQAAQRMGFSCLSLDPGEVTPASQIAPSIRGALDDVESIAKVLSTCSRVTLENEFIPAEAIRLALARSAARDSALVPGLDALATIQDKLKQKQTLLNAGIPCPKVQGITDAEGAGGDIALGIGFPCILKSRFGGYDGKGTRYARSLKDFESMRELWSNGGWMAEAHVDFRRELAQMIYVSEGAMGAFPTMESVQKDHVCDLVFPCDTDATEVALAAVKAIGGDGLFGVEMFESRDGQILVNEIAPRPHNSGHYTLDWGGISQFEQHVRLVMRLPLEVPTGGPCCMANLLGQEATGDFRNGLKAACEEPGVRVHWYGKAESRPGRKMGHLNVLGEDCVARAEKARVRFYSAWCGG